MSDDRPPSEAALWSYEGHRRRQIRRGLELSPAERLRWLETAMQEMRSLLGRAKGRSVSSPTDDPEDRRDPTG